MEIGEPDRRASPTGPVSPLPRCVQSTVYEPISIVEGIKERFSVSDHSTSAQTVRTNLGIKERFSVSDHSPILTHQEMFTGIKERFSVSDHSPR